MIARSDVEIGRLDACSFRDALRLWNEGFEGYAFDMTLSPDAYLARLHAGGVSPNCRSPRSWAAGRRASP